MKAFIALFVLAFVAVAFGLTEEQKAKGHTVKASCIEKESVTEEEVLKLKGGDFSNDSRNIRCFASCFMEGIGFIDSEGNLLADKVVEKLSVDNDKEKIQEAVNACKDIAEEDKCNKAYEIYKCYHVQKANFQ